MNKNELLIGIVGPCKSGKTTLCNGLKKLSWDAKGIAQEHSSSQIMWKKITNPDILIYLDVDYENTLKRSDLKWKPKELDEQKDRLQNSLDNADLIINTSGLSIPEVLNEAISFLNN